MISVTMEGSFKNTEKFLQAIKSRDLSARLQGHCQAGVSALAAATPVDSGLTSTSWGYEIRRYNDGFSITWTNTNVNNGVPVAILLQYGHGTGTGGYVRGVDYINPAIRPIFEKIAADIWKEVQSL